MIQLIALLVFLICSCLAPALASGAMTSFSAPTAGLNLAYPASWEVKPNPDKDTLLRISPNAASNLHAECSVALMQSIDDEKLAMGILDQMIRKQFPNYKATDKSDLYIGPKSKLKASSQSFALHVDGMDLLQKQFIVRTPSGSVVVFSFTFLPSESNLIEPFIQSVLASVQFGGKPSPSTSVVQTMAGTTADANSLVSFTSKSPSISISYPSTWKVVNDIDHDTIAKFNGHDASGRGGELTVSSLPAPRSNLEDLGPMLEENIFQKLKKYHRVREESITFGTPRSMTGQLIEGTSDIEGREARHLTCYCKENEHYFVIGLWGAGYKPGDLHALFSKILSSFRIND